ncbi:hypothetical protein Trydic_g9394 [Trypoxylus dichotomus]
MRFVWLDHAMLRGNEIKSFFVHTVYDLRLRDVLYFSNVQTSSATRFLKRSQSSFSNYKSARSYDIVHKKKEEIICYKCYRSIVNMDSAG